MASPSPKWDGFRIDTGKIVLAAQFSPEQTVHATKMIQQACQLLSAFVQRDKNILRFWSNIIEGAYADLSDTMTEQEIYTRLIREPANTGPIELAESITRPAIYIPHPSECISECRFNFEADHACTYQEGNGSIVIALHPNVFDLNLLEHGPPTNHVLTQNTSIFFCAILLAHELTHAVRIGGNHHIETPKLPFFSSNATHPTSLSTLFDGGNVIERLLLGGEIGISWTPVPFLFLIVRSGRAKVLFQPIIDACVESRSISPILQLLASNPSSVGLTSFELTCSNARKGHTHLPHPTISVNANHANEVSSPEGINALQSPSFPILTFTRTR